MTVLYVTHDQDEAFVVADRVAIMNAGRIVARGPAEETLSLPADEWTAAFLGVEQPVNGLIATVSDGLVGIDVGGTRVFVTGDGEPGMGVSLAVRPEDVLLFQSECRAAGVHRAQPHPGDGGLGVAARRHQPRRARRGWPAARFVGLACSDRRTRHRAGRSRARGLQGIGGALAHCGTI